MRWVLVMSVASLLFVHPAQAVEVVPSPPAKKVVVVHKCGPGAHWYSHYVWRDGKKVRVGHCVPDRHY